MIESADAARYAALATRPSGAGLQSSCRDNIWWNRRASGESISHGRHRRRV